MNCDPNLQNTSECFQIKTPDEPPGLITPDERFDEKYIKKLIWRLHHYVSKIERVLEIFMQHIKYEYNMEANRSAGGTLSTLVLLRHLLVRRTLNFSS